MPVNVWLIGVVAMVIIVRRLISPLVGGILGMLTAVGVAVWGWRAFDEGAGMALVGVEINRPIFLALVGMWFVFEAIGVWRTWKVRSSARKG